MKRIKNLLIVIIMFYCNTAFPFDFSAVSPSGQTLYYNIDCGNVQVTYPGSYNSGYYSGHAKPTGSLIIPDSVSYGGQTYIVTGIGDHAFCECNQLTSISIPSTVTEIQGYAFYLCSGLNSLSIPNSVTLIGIYAFYCCIGLTSINIGNSVTLMGQQAFGGCSSLPSITMKCYPPLIADNTFSGFPVNIPIHVPCGAVSSYMSAANWSNFTHFVEDCATITVMANDFTLGGVTGGGTFTVGDTVTLTAIPYFGSRFIGWSNGSQENPMTFVATTSQNFVAAFGVGELPHDTVYAHDTTYINNYIHDTIVRHVNHYIHDTTFVNNYIYDTIYLNHYFHDTIFINNYIYDTIYLNHYIFDTVYIHDTVYIQEGEGIGNIALLNAKIYQRNGQIVVEGAEGYPVYLYDVVGRLLATRRETAQEVLLDVPASGAYLVKIGDAPARRVVVRR